MVLNDIHEVVCKITEQSNAGGELAKEYEAAMGRAEVNLKSIEISQENLKSVIKQFRDKLGQSEKDKGQLRKQVYLMSFFTKALLEDISEIALWLKIFRVSQPKKNAVPQIRRGNFAILEKLRDSLGFFF